MPNIEIKARLSPVPQVELGVDPFRQTRQRALAAGGERLWEREQRDTYFVVPRGRLKLRQARSPGASAWEVTELIPYLRPDASGPKRSDYALLVPATGFDSELVERTLLSVLDTDAVVWKRREVYLIGNVRLHLDRVAGLGAFIEFEAVYEGAEQEATERSKVAHLMGLFGIEPTSLEPQSYRELVARGAGGGQHSGESAVTGRAQPTPLQLLRD